uniref:C2 domain-containing protein 5 n=1 Tax=Diabrotica virgifera virgifera TaxID=50390 RepID=A0A6P7GC02_DIAVI
MPGKVKVKISSGKNLPVMDRSSDTTDAYVEIKLGSTTFKTDVCRKSLHPQWNTDWYRFEVEDSELQDEPLQIRLMDHDTYSANDAIGKVYLNLNPLLLPVDGQIMKYGFNGDSSIHHEISGWLPVYDTMHGIRGEVNITVKVELFSDFNRFRQSSCGVQFFYSPTVPQGYQAKLIHGFVEELVVYDDPEYQWIDKIRTPRASNEARQTLFFKLSGELQRKIGVKTLNLGGNAVIGYKQSYDLEGESGIVARGIGTAITLTVSNTSSNGPILPGENKDEHNISPQADQIGSTYQQNLEQRKSDQSPSRLNILAQRRSSDSDLSTTPKGNSLTSSEKSGGHPSSSFIRNNMVLRSQIHQENFDMLEYPFLTILKFPADFISHIGGAVSARSVKRLETIRNIEEPESRDTWWSEIRMEIRSHARSLNCNAVLGYYESSSICLLTFFLQLLYVAYNGMNAIFGLKFRITVGEKLIIATATGTAIFLTSLPSPTVPKLVSDENVDDPKIITLQKQLNETVKKNKEIYKIEDGIEGSRAWSDDDSDEEPTSLDLSSGSKDCCVLEVDDPKDEEVLCSLMKERPPDGFHVVNTETIPGLDDLEIVKNLQMFIQCRRFKFQSNLNIDEYFSKLLQSVYFKLRRMVPCALCNIQFRCDIPEPDEVQLLVFGMALGLGKKSKGFKSVIPRKEEEDMIFKLEEDSITENNTVQGNKINKVNKLRSSSKYKSSLKQRHVSEGGLSGFLHSFVTEVLAIVRAHVTALGGNALVAFFLTELFLNHNFHKNQGQCLINVGGDVVSVTSYKEDT